MTTWSGPTRGVENINNLYINRIIIIIIIIIIFIIITIIVNGTHRRREVGLLLRLPEIRGCGRIRGGMLYALLDV